METFDLMFLKHFYNDHFMEHKQVGTTKTLHFQIKKK